MADGDTTTPQPGVIDPRMIDQIMAALTPQQPTPQAQPVDMSQLPVTSLLGLAVGGGPQTGMSQQDATAAGNRALLNFGVNMLAASGYSPIRRTFGETFAQGVKGAEESLASSQAVSAAQKEAQQQYTQQQIANRAEALKTGMSMQELALKLAQLRAAGQIAGVAGTGAVAGATPGTAGSGTAIARDPNVPTVGQQGNNPGNVMADSGLPMGATGFIPAGGGRRVAAYPDLTTGLAANAYTLGNYANSGVNTVRAAVTKWVGDPKADLTSYVADIAKALKVGPDDKIDLNDPKVQAAFILAQAPHETSKPWFTADDVNNGVARAADWRAGKNLPAAPGTTTTAATTPPPAPATKATTGPAPGPLAPGATVTAAPTAQGVPVPPGGTEGGAYPTAGAGIGRVLAGTTGKVGPEQVTVAPPPTPVTSPIPAGKLLSTGKPPGQASAADIILQGTKLAQGPQPPGTVLAAGPAAGTPPPAPTTTPAAQPGWGTVIGSYGPATTTAPPAAPTPTPTTQATPTPVPPPAATTTPTPHSAPGEVPSTFTYTEKPLPASIQTRIDHPEADPSLASAVQAEEKARQNYAIHGTDEAAKNWREAQVALTTAISGAREKAIEQGQTWQQNERAQDQKTWETAFAAQQAVKLKQLEGSQAVTLAQTNANIQQRQKVLEGLDTDSKADEAKLQQLQLLHELSARAGPASLLTPEIREGLMRIGWATQDQANTWSAQNALDAANQQLITAMRQGTGFQRTTNMDLQFLLHSTPGGSMQPEEFRDASGAFLMSAARRNLNFNRLVQGYMTDPSVTYADAAARADKELGPIIQQMPSGLSGSDPGKWVWDNVMPGEFYKKPGGGLAIFKPKATDVRPE